MCCFGIVPPDQKKVTARLVAPVVLEQLKEIYPFLSRVDLVGGELFDIPFEENPLVQILTDIAAAGAKNLRITLTTNGQHLSERWAEFLLQFPFIDIIAFSVDSFNPEVYARTRVMGSLDRVRRSIGNVQEAKAVRGLDQPLIRLNMILGVHTHEGILEFVENARHLGASEIEFQKLVFMGRPEFFAENNLFQPQHADKLIKMWGDLVAALVEIPSNAAETIGMIEAYLSHLGARDELVGSYGRIPFGAQYAQDSYVFPVCDTHEVSQEFVARRNSVSRIKFVPGTLQRTNNCKVVVAIEEGQKVLAQNVVDARTFTDNAWTSVDMPMISLERGRGYRLVIRSPDAPGIDDCIAVRCSKNGNGMKFDGRPHDGELAYMIF